jgi:hypothetical protein
MTALALSKSDPDKGNGIRLSILEILRLGKNWANAQDEWFSRSPESENSHKKNKKYSPR